jgi:DNA-binding IclR family transcriptional regulator
VTSLPALRASLEEIRGAGVCVSVDEMVRGAAGIAAPIFDRHGRVVGACAIGGPTDRVRPQLRPLACDVTAAARAISALLGHRTPEEPRPARRVP